MSRPNWIKSRHLCAIFSKSLNGKQRISWVPTAILIFLQSGISLFALVDWYGSNIYNICSQRKLLWVKYQSASYYWLVLCFNEKGCRLKHQIENNNKMLCPIQLLTLTVFIVVIIKINLHTLITELWIYQIFKFAKRPKWLFFDYKESF